MTGKCLKKHNKLFLKPSLNSFNLRKSLDQLASEQIRFIISMTILDWEETLSDQQRQQSSQLLMSQISKIRQFYSLWEAGFIVNMLHNLCILTHFICVSSGVFVWLLTFQCNNCKHSCSKWDKKNISLGYCISLQSQPVLQWVLAWLQHVGSCSRLLMLQLLKHIWFTNSIRDTINTKPPQCL